MRPIKFRAWDNDKRKLSAVVNDIDFRLETVNAWNPSDNEFSFGKLKLTQFTGLLDKTGKEIYEGDIFGKYEHSGDYAEQYEPYGRVYFDDDLAAFCVERTNGGWEYLHDFLSGNLTKLSEVIGNIYEHPDLLKQ